MLGGIAKALFGSSNDRYVKSVMKIVQKINALEPEISAMTDERLAQQTQLFRDRLTAGETLDDILPVAFATVREASKRVMGMRHFDVQMVGGIVLHRGEIAEMRTGEGKTLTETLACYLNALEGKGVRLARISTRYTGTGQTLADALPKTSLNDLQPEDVLRQRWAREHEGEPPADLLAAYHQLIGEAQADPEAA